MQHIPLLRAGQSYQSLTTQTVRHIATGEPVAQVSQANRGLIARDLHAMTANQRTLMDFSVDQLIALSRQAAEHFMYSELPLGDATQSADQYIYDLSSTSGLPVALCRKNMEKIRLVMDEIEAVLGGLTRGLDLSILDNGFGMQQDRPLSYACQTRSLGAILPSNSPGVHSLWQPAIPLKVPLVLKPGSEEPWTPYRIAQAYIAAGCPPQAFSYYPTDYSGAGEILMHCGRTLFFGASSTIEAWKDDPHVQLHGTGFSKVLFGTDQLDQWSEHLGVIERSVVENGGRSCINASGIWTPAQGHQIATALAQRLAQIQARPLDDPKAQLAAFTRPDFAKRISAMIDQQLKIPGAKDLTAAYRDGERLVQEDGCTYLLPTVIWCSDPTHPLAQIEFLFPCVSVVEVPQDQIVEAMGPTLVATAITQDADLILDLLATPEIDRLNLGPIPTNRISWDQPHEGNLFEFLYRQRAFQQA